jgi:hypothetical protein
MKQHRQPPIEHLPATRWQWPLDIAAYDRGIELSPEEIDALDCRYNSRSPRLPFKSIPALSRLIRPLEDVIAHISIRKAQKMGMVPLMMREVHRRRMTYWGWSLAEWRETLGPDYESFCGRHHAATQIKLQVMAVGYLLHHIDDLHAVAKFSQLTFVKQVFNAQAVDASIERVRQELQRWGYGKRRTIGQLPSTLSELMIAARSPYLEDIRL